MLLNLTHVRLDWQFKIKGDGVVIYSYKSLLAESIPNLETQTCDGFELTGLSTDSLDFQLKIMFSW